MAAAPPIMLALLGAGASLGMSKLMAPKAPAQQALPDLPQPPSATDAVAKADDAIRRRKAVQTQSVFTNPLGVSGQADVVKKQLTGQ